jgi:hypothetical protein
MLERLADAAHDRDLGRFRPEERAITPGRPVMYSSSG